MTTRLPPRGIGVRWAGFARAEGKPIGRVLDRLAGVLKVRAKTRHRVATRRGTERQPDHQYQRESAMGRECPHISRIGQPIRRA